MGISVLALDVTSLKVCLLPTLNITVTMFIYLLPLKKLFFSYTFDRLAQILKIVLKRTIFFVLKVKKWKISKNYIIGCQAVQKRVFYIQSLITFVKHCQKIITLSLAFNISNIIVFLFWSITGSYIIVFFLKLVD